MYTTRKILGEDLSAWDAFVNASPHASLFHTSAWNDMLKETDPERPECTYLVCEKGGKFLGGIAWHHATKGLENLPMFGYNGPIFNPELNYQESTKTVPGYEVFQELLKGITGLTSQLVIKNQPEIWDVRAFAFNRWRLETRYTHILSHANVEMTLALQHNSSEDQYAISKEATDTQIQKFYLQIPSKGKRNSDIFSRRLYWLRERGLAQLVTLTNKKGDELAVALFLFSKENRTIYLCQIQKFGNGMDQEILSHLIVDSFLALGKGFNQMDLGESANMATSQAKDNLGGTLTPFFVARYKEK